MNFIPSSQLKFGFGRNVLDQASVLSTLTPLANPTDDLRPSIPTEHRPPAPGEF
jgi:hypothetical protein